MNYELPKDMKLAKKDDKNFNEILKRFIRGLKHGFVVIIILLIIIVIWRIK